MLLLKLLCLFFLGLIVREFLPSRSGMDAPRRFDPIYTGLLLALAVSCAWMPFKYWQFEKTMAKRTAELAGVPEVTFHCNSAFDSIFDNDPGVAGHANPTTRRVVFQLGWCKSLMRYLDDPEGADQEARFSLHMFTHEAMHIRGELYEPKADCEALQRDVQAAGMLGVPQDIARRHARDYYDIVYPRHPYFSSDCGPGKPMDESMPDAPWTLPATPRTG